MAKALGDSMPSPIERAIDAAMRCLKCGKGMGDPECCCWVTITCRGCGRRKMVERDKTDPPATARVDCICDRCDQGDKAEVFYFDSSGRQIMDF